MTRGERILYWGRLFALIMLFGIWGALYHLATYVRAIPSRRLPFAEYFSGNNPRLYQWLYDVLMSIFKWGLLVFLAIKVLSVLLLDVSAGQVSLALLEPLQRNQPMLFLQQFLAYLFDLARESLFGSDWTGALISRALAFCALALGYWRAKTVHWDWLRWQVLPAARTWARQVNGPEAEPDEELIRHLMDCEAGLNKGWWLVDAGELKVVGKAAGWAARFGGPGILITQEGHAVVLEKSGGISRVVGRGITYLEPFERPTMVVKLHTQSVKLSVARAFTRDGGVIEKIEALVFCKLDKGRANMDRGLRFPFDDALILDKVWDPKHSDPQGALQSICATVLLEVIAGHTLQEFFDDFERMRRKISEELKNEANKKTMLFLGYQIIATALNNVEVPHETEQKLWQRWGVVQDVKIDTTRAHGEWQIEKGKAKVDVYVGQLRAEMERMIGWTAAAFEREMRLLSAGTEREIAERQAALQRNIDQARAQLDLQIKMLTAGQDRVIRRRDADVDLEIKWLTEAQNQEIKRSTAEVDLEIKQLTTPMEIELQRLIASNNRLIKRLDEATNIEVEQDKRHATNESDLERLKMLSEGEKYIESSGGDLRIELFTRFVRMMQLAGHEPTEDTLKELARSLLTSHSPRGTSLALRRVLYRAITGRGTIVPEKTIGDGRDAR